jgi:hypothetical protein
VGPALPDRSRNDKPLPQPRHAPAQMAIKPEMHRAELLIQLEITSIDATERTAQRQPSLLSFN